MKNVLNIILKMVRVIRPGASDDLVNFALGSLAGVLVGLALGLVL